MIKQWEYGSIMAGFIPIDGQLSQCVITLHDQPWDCISYPMHPARMLNILGEGGWEVIAVVILGNSGDQDSAFTRYELKRERQVTDNLPPASDAVTNEAVTA